MRSFLYISLFYFIFYIPSLISPVIPKITLEYVVHPPPPKKGSYWRVTLSI